MKIKYIKDKESYLEKIDNDNYIIHYASLNDIEHEIKHIYLGLKYDELFSGILDYDYDTDENLEKFIFNYLIMVDYFIEKKLGNKHNFLLYIKNKLPNKTNFIKQIKSGNLELLKRHPKDILQILNKICNLDNIIIKRINNKIIIKRSEKMKKILFLSNHSDTSPIKSVLGNDIEIEWIKHPYIEAEWNINDIKENCKEVIKKCINVDTLILNGDYTLVYLIVIERFRMKKKTGFISFKKLSKPDGTIKLPDGSIKHSNILKPVGIRWIIK